MDLLNAFTVDVEDYFHVSAFERRISRDDWGRYASRVATNTNRILDLLDRHGVKATFFVLGWVGKRHPQLVREIHARGHEIGSHSFRHRLVYEQSPDEFRGDLIESRDVLEAEIQAPVTAYRAPSFSITNRSLWALEILAEEGFRVDSSIFPIAGHNRYGIAGADPGIHKITTPSGPLWEFPPSVVRIGRFNLPVGGGGYFRLYPIRLTVLGLSRIHRTTGRPLMFYIHPWEIDPGQPRLRSGSWQSQFRHYVNLSKTERKLTHLFQRFRFARICDVIRQTTTSQSPTSAGTTPPSRPSRVAT